MHFFSFLPIIFYLKSPNLSKKDILANYILERGIPGH
jgi:hypothetical protein